MTTYTFEELLPHLDLDDLPRCPNRTFSSMSLKHNPDLYKTAFLIHAELIYDIHSLGLEDGDFRLVYDPTDLPHLGIKFYRDTDGQLVGELTRLQGMTLTGPLTDHPAGLRTHQVLASSPAELSVNDGSWLKILALLHALLTT